MNVTNHIFLILDIFVLFHNTYSEKNIWVEQVVNRKTLLLIFIGYFEPDIPANILYQYRQKLLGDIDMRKRGNCPKHISRFGRRFFLHILFY